MKNMNLDEFTTELAAKKPVPGGGGAAAVTGALAASLSAMVINYTKGKKRFAKYNDELDEIMIKSEQLRREMLILIEEDALAFEPLSKAYGLPNTTDEEKKHKDEVMETALNHAAVVPLKIAEKCCVIIKLHDRLSVICSKLVLSDVGVGAVLAKSALSSAALNVYINTSSMKNKAKADEYNSKINSIIAEYEKIADETYQKVFNYINR